MQEEIVNGMVNSLSIACLGDSITNGFGVRSPWRLIMRQRLRERYPEIRFRVLNAGVDGDTLSGGCRRLRRDVLRHNPDLTTIAFGLNDLYMGVPVAEFRRNLSEVVEKITLANCRMVLMTTIRPAACTQLLGGESPELYNEIIRKLAGRMQIPLLDVWESWPQMDDPWCYFLSDGVHPNDAGHTFLGKLSADFLAPLLL